MANGQLVALGGRRIGKPYARTNSFCQEGKNLFLKMATSPQKPKEISILNTQKLHFLWQMNCISVAFSNSIQTLPNLQKHRLLPGMCAPIMPPLSWNNASIATEPKFKFSTHITVEALQKEIGWWWTSWLNFFPKITSILHKEHLISALLTMSTQSITSAFLFSLHFSCSRVKRRDPYLTFPCKMPALPICHFFIISIEWKKVIRLKTIFQISLTPTLYMVG